MIKKGILIAMCSNKFKYTKYYWKVLINGIVIYLYKYKPFSMRNKSGIIIKWPPVQIITKGPFERFVVDGMKLPKSLAELSGYAWDNDIIDQFKKNLALSY